MTENKKVSTAFQTDVYWVFNNDLKMEMWNKYTKNEQQEQSFPEVNISTYHCMKTVSYTNIIKYIIALN